MRLILVPSITLGTILKSKSCCNMPSESCGRGVPTKVVCAECMKMCRLGGKNSVVKGLRDGHMVVTTEEISLAYFH